MNLRSLPRTLRQRLDGPGEWLLLARMAGWWAALSLLRPRLGLQALSRLADPGPSRPALPPAAARRCLRLLDESGLPRRGGCLPRALVQRRYLLLAGLQPRLLVGFGSGEADPAAAPNSPLASGHAWVELSGQPFLEPPTTLLCYPPSLVISHESSQLRSIEPPIPH